jgi:hypothetical protein
VVCGDVLSDIEEKMTGGVEPYEMMLGGHSAVEMIVASMTRE